MHNTYLSGCMEAYIGWLPGVNVGGHRKVQMATLREVLQQEGLQDVATYVQSGNFVFKGPPGKSLLSLQLEKVIAAHFGFSVPVVLLRPAEVRALLEAHPFQGDREKCYYVFFKDSPDPALESRLEAGNYPGQRWQLAPWGIYLWCEEGYGKARLNNNEIERLGQVRATTRNHRTLCQVLEMAAGLEAS
ncbi:DUF1697 domain-containing protein [Robiginitalea sp. M366]|uniref:DUF1697 domain-containing protein n=1 Tax=Robiginitalea aestuariiviva TaxID=3036903 RepID=UPI00240DC23E|nr:DUF1697 domain-containing protein [Robiginitalea aestuariiviva]MDG1571831.1 DUF1697 domain-containing protein [Robiginitalea aestuariiviva]